jgi:presenilin-like A22 family membrane protease
VNGMIKIILGAIGGGLVGFLYYKFIGCRSGACPIAGNPWISTGWWALIGGMFMSGLK